MVCQNWMREKLKKVCEKHSQMDALASHWSQSLKKGPNGPQNIGSLQDWLRLVPVQQLKFSSVHTFTENL